MKLYLVRHGESIANKEHKHQGDRFDTDLTELGFEQAKKLAKRLKDHKFDIIYSSHLKRAVQTTNKINFYHNKEIIINENLKEKDQGDFSGKVYSEELWQNIKGDIIEKRAPNGENRIDQFERVKPVVEEILNLDKDILIVSHGGTIRAILASLFPTLGLKKVHEIFETHNTCLYEIEFDENQNPSIILENCIKHLEE